jgi:hypothetical protein
LEELQVQVCIHPHRHRFCRKQVGMGGSINRKQKQSGIEQKKSKRKKAREKFTPCRNKPSQPAR